MRKVFLFLVALSGLTAGDLQLFIHTPGTTPDGPPLGSSFIFADTPLGASSSITARLKNTSADQTYLVRTVWSSDTSFTVDGAFLDNCLGPGGFEDLIVAFVPSALGPASVPLQIADLPYSSSAGCPATPPTNFQVNTLATLSGNGIAPTYSVSVSINGTTTPLTSGNTIGFGNVPVGGVQTATITVQNGSGSTVPLPTPALITPVFSQSPYSLGSLIGFPSSLAPGATASFTLSFTPTQQALITASLSLGTRTYPLVGNGIPGPGLESLLVSYTLPTTVHYTITPATPVDFGSDQIGTSETFVFTVSNPLTNFGPQTISTISISGSDFSLTSLPNLPVVLKPGDTTAFNVVFAPKQSGSRSATLAIGTLQYNLVGKALAPTLNPTFQITPGTLASSEQAHLSIQLASAVEVNTICTLAISFTSAVSGIADDPAVLFVSTNTRTTNATFSPGASTATFLNGQTSLTFQTGTTAGTVNFKLSTADGQAFTKSLDIAPTPVQISLASATRQSPYLVIDLTAFDNTYSAGKMLFNFYDTKRALITTGGISIDETTAFHNYFFGNNQIGGAFILQAKFPVTGDAATVAAADVSIQNSSGQSQTQHLTF